MKLNLFLIAIFAFALIFAQQDLDSLSLELFELTDDLEELETETLSTQPVTLTVSSYSNEYWIQIEANPGGVISSLRINSPVQQEVPNVDWDHGKGNSFVSSTTKIPFGSQCDITVRFKDGKTGTVKLTWNVGAQTSINRSGTSPQPQPQPTHPIGQASQETKSFISKVKGYSHPGSYPSAQITGEDSLRRKNKDALLKATNSLGITDVKAKAFIFAAFGLETELMYYGNGEAQRDTSKDHTTDGSKNYSPLNMNYDMLKNYVHYKGNFDSLNKIANIKECVKVLIQAVNKLGLGGFVNFHRGGRSGYENPKKYEAKFKMQAFRVGLYNIMMKYMEDTSLFTDGRKVWSDIPHV